MLVVEASEKPSPKQPLGQRREFVPCRRLAAHHLRATVVSHFGAPGDADYAELYPSRMQVKIPLPCM